jgi:thiaminase (transcriptional activator TenA)
MPDHRTGAGPRPTELLHRRSAAAFDHAMEHRFIAEATAGTLSTDVFERYLTIELGFVDTAARTLGRAIQLAPTIDERRHLAKALSHLVEDQRRYFEQAMPAAAAAHTIGRAGDGPEAALHRHFLDTADHGDYLTLLAASLGAEWLYATWCAQAAATDPTPPREPRLTRWIELHVAPAFVMHVLWLRDQLDHGLADVASNHPTFRACQQAFEATLHAEVEFHTAAYQPPPSS